MIVELHDDLTRETETYHPDDRIRFRNGDHQDLAINGHPCHHTALVVDVRAEWTDPERRFDEKRLGPVKRNASMKQADEL